MPGPRYTLLTGDFYILYTDLPRNGPEPDGDTISSLPDNDDLVHSLPRFSDREIIKQLRATGARMWPNEAVTREARAQPAGLADLSTLVIFPKLYRRLVRYFKDGHVDLTAFDTWVRADPVGRDDQALLPTGELGHLHDLYDGPGG